MAISELPMTFPNDPDLFLWEIGMRDVDETVVVRNVNFSGSWAGRATKAGQLASDRHVPVSLVSVLCG
jgi:hypothetical protein